MTQQYQNPPRTQAQATYRDRLEEMDSFVQGGGLETEEGYEHLAHMSQAAQEEYWRNLAQESRKPTP